MEGVSDKLPSLDRGISLACNRYYTYYGRLKYCQRASVGNPIATANIVLRLIAWEEALIKQKRWCTTFQHSSKLAAIELKLLCILELEIHIGDSSNCLPSGFYFRCRFLLNHALRQRKWMQILADTDKHPLPTCGRVPSSLWSFVMQRWLQHALNHTTLQLSPFILGIKEAETDVWMAKFGPMKIK